MNISSAIKTTKSIITANSPVLLVGTAIAGVVSTGVLAARAGYKARGMVDEAEQEKGAPLTVQDKARLTWLCYVPPGVTGATTIAATIGVHTIHTKRHAALAGLYAISSSKLDAYTEQAEDMLGAKKAQELNNKVAQQRADGVPFENNEVVLTGMGSELCFDDLGGRWFQGSIPKVEEAVNDLNRRIISEGEVSLNDFYELVGLEETALGGKVGWNADDKIQARFGSVNSKDGRPAISIWFQPEPKFGRIPA